MRAITYFKYQFDRFVKWYLYSYREGFLSFLTLIGFLSLGLLFTTFFNLDKQYGVLLLVLLYVLNLKIDEYWLSRRISEIISTSFSETIYHIVDGNGKIDYPKLNSIINDICDELLKDKLYKEVLVIKSDTGNIFSENVDLNMILEKVKERVWLEYKLPTKS